MAIQAKQRLVGSRVAGPFSREYRMPIQARWLEPLPPPLTRAAKARLAWMDYTSYPRCPKQNAFVERVIRTAIDEFYLFNEIPVELAEHAAALEAFDRDYSTVRPHESLGYLTPMEYHERRKTADPPS